VWAGPLCSAPPPRRSRACPRAAAAPTLSQGRRWPDGGNEGEEVRKVGPHDGEAGSGEDG
jgi:hypothetical protein